MNKDEMKMIEDMRAIIQREHSDCMSNLCENCDYYAMNYCGSVKKANALHNAGCRIIGDDEIVIKKSEQKQWLKDCIESNKKTEEITREETAREILQELYDEAMRYTNEIVELSAFQIEQRAKEKGIELE